MKQKYNAHIRSLNTDSSSAADSITEPQMPIFYTHVHQFEHDKERHDLNSNISSINMVQNVDAIANISSTRKRVKHKQGLPNEEVDKRNELRHGIVSEFLPF